MTFNNRQKLFNEIAPYYDFFNNIISFGMHKTIKKESVKLLNPKGFGYDLCCGTGDITSIIKNKGAEVIGIDFSKEMLNIAKTKYPNINFKQNDCSTLQLDSGTADFCSIAFGLRNIINKEESIKEMYRILKPNGKLMYLDFSNNKNFVDKTFNKFLLTFGNDKYKYLAISKSNFWNVKELKENFEIHGFKTKREKYFVFGTLVAIIFQK